MNADRCLEWAERYAQRGWPVFPVHSARVGVCTCRQVDCSSPAKHPLTTKGLKDASTDLEVIREWWRRWPEANVAIATGRGLVALDIDPRHEGDESLRALRRRVELPATAEVTTGGGGQHLYFAVPGVTIRNSASKLGKGLDVRGDGGYVVAPPSVHQSGQRYAWHGDAPVAEAPASLVALLAASDKASARERRSALGGWPTLVTERVREGERNETIASLAGLLLRRLEPVLAFGLLLGWNARFCDPPISEDEVAKTVDSIAGRELRSRVAR